MLKKQTILKSSLSPTKSFPVGNKVPEIFETFNSKTDLNIHKANNSAKRPQNVLRRYLVLTSTARGILIVYCFSIVRLGFWVNNYTYLIVNARLNTV
jgi:hypothetical protein